MVLDIDDSGAVPAEDDHRFSEEVLVTVDRQRPELPFLDDRLGDELKTHVTSLVGECPARVAKLMEDHSSAGRRHSITASDNPLPTRSVAPHCGPSVTRDNPDRSCNSVAPAVLGRRARSGRESH